jgi:hypothetical protein
MATLDERVTRLEEVIPTLATKDDLERFATKDDLLVLEKRIESRLYTVTSEMEGRIDAKFSAMDAKFATKEDYLALQAMVAAVQANAMEMVEWIRKQPNTEAVNGEETDQGQRRSNRHLMGAC